MTSLPQLKRLENKADLDQYGQIYLQCSGLPIPERYLYSSDNRVYAIYYNRKIIGGFILGKGQSLRTLEVFAQSAYRHDLYRQLGEIKAYTEITCFWISPDFRKNTALNTAIWLSLAYGLKRYGNRKILFGTCSSSLARLYGVTPHAQLIHRDMMNGKHTFIFQSERKGSLRGFLEILRFKLGRTIRLRQRRQPVRQRA